MSMVDSLPAMTCLGVAASCSICDSYAVIPRSSLIRRQSWPRDLFQIHQMLVNTSTIPALYQVSSQLLLALYRLKQRFEIAGSETREVVSLYNLDKNRWTIHQVLISFVSVYPSTRHWLVVTLVKSCRRYPPSSKSIRISRLFSVSKSSFRTMPCFFSLNLMFS
jgi:hypothetical protein